MSRWTDAQLTAALGLGAHAGGEDVAFSGVSTDTRALQPGTLFVAEYAKFIVHKSQKLGSAGQLPQVRKAIG